MVKLQYMNNICNMSSVCNNGVVVVFKQWKTILIFINSLITGL